MRTKLQIKHLKNHLKTLAVLMGLLALIYIGWTSSLDATKAQALLAPQNSASGDAIIQSQPPLAIGPTDGVALLKNYPMLLTLWQPSQNSLYSFFPLSTKTTEGLLAAAILCFLLGAYLVVSPSKTTSPAPNLIRRRTIGQPTYNP